MRFWVTVAIFGVLNAILWLVLIHRQSLAANTAHVVICSYHDGDELARDTALTWLFDRDMSPADLIHGQPAQLSPGFTGSWSWEGPRTLELSPTAVPKASPLRIVFLADQLHGADGRGAALPDPLELHSPALAVLGCQEVDLLTGGDHIIAVAFSDQVDPHAALRHLRVANRLGQPVACVPVGDALGDQLRFQVGPPGLVPDADGTVQVTIRIAPGLRGENGPLALATPVVRTVILDAHCRVMTATAAQPSEGPAEVILTLNRSCPLERLRAVVSVSPSLPITITGSGNMATLSGDFVSGRRYHVVVGPPPAGSPGIVPEPDRLPVVIPDREASFWFAHEEGYLGAQGSRHLLAHAVNLRQVHLTIWRVYDSNLIAWQLLDRYRIERLAHQVADRVLRTEGERNRTTDLGLALDDLLPQDARGDGVYQLQVSWRREDEEVASVNDDDPYGSWRSDSASCLISLSDISLQARLGDGLCDAWCWSLATTRPLAARRLRLYSSKQQLLAEGLSDAEGHVRLAWSPCAPGESPSLLLADGPGGSPGLTWLSLEASALADGRMPRTGRPYLSRGAEAFVYAERGIYRPGERAHLRALIRGVRGAVPGVFPVQWRVLRPDRRLWFQRTVLLDPTGDVSLDLDVPGDCPTGTWSVAIAKPGDAAVMGSMALAIEDFTPQRLRVALVLQGVAASGVAAPAGAAGPPAPTAGIAAPRSPASRVLQASVQADYLFGAPGAGLHATALGHLTAEDFQPGDRPGWTFSDRADTLAQIDHLERTAQRLALAPVVLDAHGHGSWTITPADVLPADGALRGCPWRATVLASVAEPGGRTLSTGAREVVVDPLDSYCGFRLPDQAVLGTEVQVPLAAERADGGLDTAAARPVSIAVYQQTWDTQVVAADHAYRYVSQSELVRLGEVRHAVLQGGTGSIALTFPVAGSYVVRLQDDATHQVASQALYVTGAGTGWDEAVSRQDPEHCDLTIAPRGESPPAPPGVAEALRVGATAVVTVRAPFAGQLLLTVETDHVIDWRSLTMTASSTAIALPITDAWLPGAHLTATVVRPVLAGGGMRVQRVYATISAPLLDRASRLQVQIQATAPGVRWNKEVLPIVLQVHRDDGIPQPQAQVTVSVVDEGVLALTNFTTPDPAGFFAAQRRPGVAGFDAYDLLVPEVSGGGTVPGGDEGVAMSRYRPAVAVRQTHVLSWWSGVLTSDDQGRISIKLPIPQTFNGRLRIMVVADAGARTGSAETAVVLRNNLVVQSTWPRCVAPGDRFTISVTLFNHTAQPQQVWVHPVFEARGLLSCDARQAPIPVPAAGSTVLSLPITATGGTGSCAVQVHAQIGSPGLYQKEAPDPESMDENEVLVRIPEPLITTGAEQRIDAAHPASLPAPGGWVPGSVTMTVRLAPLPALSLPQGLERLYRYPYGCAEQVISANFPLLALRDLSVANPERFPPAGVAQRLASGISQLQLLQTENGGIATWSGERTPWPWASVYAAHFLVCAKQAGVAVPDDLLRGLLRYLQHLGDGLDDSLVELQAYGCYVLALAGQPDAALMQRLEERLDSADPTEQVGASSRFLLSLAWAAVGRIDAARSLIPDTLPHLDAPAPGGTSLESAVCDRAWLLTALLTVAPDHPAIPALAQELARSETWGSTQDTAMALLALGRYLRQARQDVPATAVRLIIDGTPQIQDPPGTAYWSGPGAQAIEAAVQGPAQGVAWLSWTLTGIPATPQPDVSAGMTVTRQWQVAGGGDGSTVASGNLIAVTLRVESARPLTRVVVEDLLPGGLEVENPRIQGSVSAAAGLASIDPFASGSTVTGASAGDEQPPVDDPAIHLDVRDDRLVIMGDLRAQPHGDYALEYRYLLRAVVPGTYVRPPVRAECMYDSSIHALQGGGHLTVTLPR